MIASANIKLDFSFNGLLDLIIDRQYFLPVEASWTEAQCSAWQDRNVEWLINVYHLNRKDAEVEVSWFIDRYGIKTN